MTYKTSIQQSPSSVRNASENAIYAPSVRDMVNDLLTLLDGSGHYKNVTALHEDLARRLSTIAHKDPPWNHRYIVSVASGSLTTPGKKFCKAVQDLAVTFDGVPVPIAKSSPVTVYAETGTVMDGALVMGASRRCVTPSCTVVFVPNVPWRKLCPICSPQKGGK